MLTGDKVGSRSLAIFYNAAYPFTDGGGQRRLYEVGRYMAAHGWRVHWYALKTWDGDPVQIRDGIVYYGLKGHTGFFRKNGKRGSREALSYGRAVLAARADFGSYDLVWCAQWPFFHILALIVRLVPWRTQVLVDWWGVWGRYWLDYAGWVARSQRMRLAGGVLSPSYGHRSRAGDRRGNRADALAGRTSLLGRRHFGDAAAGRNRGCQRPLSRTREVLRLERHRRALPRAHRRSAQLAAAPAGNVRRIGARKSLVSRGASA